MDASRAQRLRLEVSLFMGAATVVLGGAIWVSTAGHDVKGLLALTGLALGYVLPVLATRVRWRLVAKTLQLMSGVVASASLGAFVWMSGGTHSPGYLGEIAVPIAMGLLVPEMPWVCLSSGLTAAVFAGATALKDGSSPSAAAVVAGMAVAAGVVGAYGVFQYRWTREGELRAERERREVLEKLALLQRQTAEAERLATVGRLAAGVGHEINNPLAFVVSNLEFLRSELGPRLTPEQRESLADATEGVTRITHIVKDLSVLARDGTPGVERGDAAAAVEAAARISSVRRRAKAALETDAPGPLPVAMNEGRLVQVLVNLVVNALDALDELPERAGHVWLRAREEEDAVRVVVEDDGPGVRPEVRSRLFDPFFTTKPTGRGTGLGLALCRQYVTERGGRLEVDERPGGGARFTVTLHRAADG